MHGHGRVTVDPRIPTYSAGTGGGGGVMSHLHLEKFLFLFFFVGISSTRYAPAVDSVSKRKLVLGTTKKSATGGEVVDVLHIH